jgi:hypothetical protein
MTRQLGPLLRQAALAEEADRLNAADLPEDERRRAVMALGKVNPAAREHVAHLTGRVEEIAAQVRAEAVADWDTPDRRAALARARVHHRDLAQAAELLRRAVSDAAAIAPDLPEVRAVLATAAAAEQAAAPACAGPDCAAPLPAAEPGRVRRYCSARCRTRARRAGANR